MAYILLSIIAVAALVVAGMSAVHGPAIITTGPAAIAPAAFTDWGSLWPWLLAVVVIGLCGWWLFRRRRS